MAGDQSPQQRPDLPSGANDGWVAVGYLLSGILVWGGVGWLIDRWLDTGGIATAVGSIVGVTAGIYLVLRRFSAHGP
jgi:F0F1-type ATP synthase assembly protein I